MAIAQRIARAFRDSTRARGQAYFGEGRVIITAEGRDGGEIRARVRGQDQDWYRVRLKLRGFKLHASCTCPFFKPQGKPCKHLWATILAADARTLLQPPSPTRPIKLVPHVPTTPDAVVPPPTAESQPVDPTIGHIPPGWNRPRPGYYPTNYGNYNGNSADSPPASSYQRPRSPSPRDIVGRVQKGPSRPQSRPAVRVQSKRLLMFVLDIPASISMNQVVIEPLRRVQRRTGEWGPYQPWWPPGPAHRNHPSHRLEIEDSDLLRVLRDAQVEPTTIAAAAPLLNSQNPAGSLPPNVPLPALAGGGGQTNTGRKNRFVIKSEHHAEIIRALCLTGRMRVRRAESEEDPPPLHWDEGPPWRFRVDIRSDAGGKRFAWRGSLHRRDSRMDLVEPLLVLPQILVMGSGRAARFDDGGASQWVARLRTEKEIVVPENQQDAMLTELLSEAIVPPHRILESLQLDEIRIDPKPCLTLRTPPQNWGIDRVMAELSFDYDGARVGFFPAGTLTVQSDHNRVIHRDPQAEHEAAVQLVRLGFRETKDYRVDPGTLEIAPKRVSQITRDLVAAGWMVEAEGRLIRPPGEFKLAVTTGIDWFELGGGIDFGGQRVSLPDLLAAASSGETMINLGDGSVGMLPEDWLKKYGMLAELGVTEDGSVRFGRAQAGLVDALLAAQPQITCDAGFQAVRASLHSFDGVQPAEAPPGFQGELRPYQCEGLGWLEYLTKFEFGGILADDMGLGKTVQVLALLQSRRARRKIKGPSLIVVPRSLVFNWLQEAERFTPRLRVLDYTGTARHPLRDQFSQYDLIVTTYGTLRGDILELSKMTFDYVILDEAQAIKNADSQSSKATRLLKARHRLALSGTPIENHIGELWAIMEFLNPGMLGSAGVFKRFSGVGGGAALDDEGKALLSKALRPFILRRTKSQVVKDLPEKTEQTLICTMEADQRRCYDELKEHYRRALLRKETAELNRSQIEVLEALLRLRQAACHPGLIDPSRAGEASAKLDMLLPQIAEVVEEGHKVLVFSQFTRFLAIVRDLLDKEGLTYEYLDGQTRDRARRVERFQTDPDCPIFLISLKAGGLGLNLTAAEYVYLLDPWWNPAVEAQAIDRSHRIGQTRHVFAYRLICRDTVEQKILELQQRKRELADAILSEDNRVIQSLTREDLEYLLS